MYQKTTEIWYDLCGVASRHEELNPTTMVGRDRRYGHPREIKLGMEGRSVGVVHQSVFTGPSSLKQPRCMQEHLSHPHCAAHASKERAAWGQN
jgi:hypothetical protein